MNLILLPGNHITNRDRIEKIEKNLEDLFDSTYIQYYKHWQTNKNLINLEEELKILTKEANSFGKYTIFAKSAGALLALRGIFEGKISPLKCIFVGTPMSWDHAINIQADKWLRNYSVPTLFIQQTKDPFMSYQKLVKPLEKSKAKNYQIKEIPGETHNYENISQLKQLVSEFISTKLTLF